MHLYADTLSRYLERDLPPETLSSIDVHVSNCLACAHRLTDLHTAGPRWERRGFLGRLVRVEEPAYPTAAAEERAARAA
jgi:hypothetical protein